MKHISLIISVYLHFYLIKELTCECIQSYATICESVAEWQTFQAGQTSEIIIEPRYSLKSLKMPLDLNQFRDAISLTIVSQTNRLIPERGCYYGSGLKFVNLYDNNLEKIEKGAIPRLSNIIKLKLVYNKIRIIEAETFAECQPEIIDLSENQIEAIDSYTFTDPYSINKTKIIILDKNKLSAIEPDSFPSTLELLKLDDNMLSFIDPQVFQGLNNLIALTLSRNKFLTVPDTRFLTKLKTIDLSYNRVKNLNGGTFRNRESLNVIDLSHNKIAQIDRRTFTLFRGLTNVDLSHNKIKDVNFLNPLYDTFVHVSLEFNLVKDITFGNDKNKLSSSLSLGLYGNPWKCYDWIFIERDLVNRRIGRGKCDLMLFGTGDAPFCLCDLEECKYFQPTGASRYVRRDLDPGEVYAVEHFLNVTKRSRKLVKCSTSLKNTSQ